MGQEVLEKSAADDYAILDEHITVVDNTAERKEAKHKAEKKPQKAYTKKRCNSKIIITAAVITVFAAASVGAAALFTYQQDVKNKAEAAEKELSISKQTPVSSTDEAIKFRQERYSIKVGKSVKATYKYTPPYKNVNLPEPYVTFTSNNINVATVDKKGNIKGVATGTTSIVAVTDTGVYTTVPVTVTAPSNHTIDDVPLIYQGEEYPSGCESVSSTMLLQYYGYNIDVDDFIDDYLTTDYFTFDKNGKMKGPDTCSAFIGSPYSTDSLGCFPPVIEASMNKFLKTRGHRAVDVTGASMEYLTTHYIANDKPVLIWATMWMQEPFVTYEWTVEGAADYSPYKDGDTCKWLANEHCMVLTGYDEDNYYLNDPLNTSTAIYDRETFDLRYTQMGRCALVLEELSE